jgi:hypothetical protein
LVVNIRPRGNEAIKKDQNDAETTSLEKRGQEEDPEKRGDRRRERSEN